MAYNDKHNWSHTNGTNESKRKEWNAQKIHTKKDERKEQREREKPKWARKEASEHVATAREEHEGAQCWR